MKKSTKVFLIVLVGFIVLAIVFKDVRSTESFAVYDGCTQQEIVMGCHADAVRMNWLGLITPISILAVIITFAVFVIYKTVKHFKKH